MLYSAGCNALGMVTSSGISAGLRAAAGGLVAINPLTMYATIRIAKTITRNFIITSFCFYFLLSLDGVKKIPRSCCVTGAKQETILFTVGHDPAIAMAD
jgi:hypothetical protein